MKGSHRHIPRSRSVIEVMAWSEGEARPILVTGGTGTLGAIVATRLLDAGRRVRVLSRGQRLRQDDPRIEFVRADLATGEDVDTAVEGAGVIVHCAGSAKGDEVKAANLVRAASGADVRHLVFISVVGAERIPVRTRIDRAMFGYFASKLAAERVVSASDLPWSTLRATQFHQLLLTTLAGMAKLPVIPVPGIHFQPIDAAEVADRLVELALGEPAGLVPDIGGPAAYELAELLRGYLRATHRRRVLIPMPMVGAAARAMRSGANLTQRRVGHRTWEAFLASRLSVSASNVTLSSH